MHRRSNNKKSERVLHFAQFVLVEQIALNGVVQGGLFPAVEAGTNENCQAANFREQAFFNVLKRTIVRRYFAQQHRRHARTAHRAKAASVNFGKRLADHEEVTLENHFGNRRAVNINRAVLALKRDHQVKLFIHDHLLRLN